MLPKGLTVAGWEISYSDFDPKSNRCSPPAHRTESNLTAALPVEGANKFTFTGDEGITQIIYYPQAPGPLSADPLLRGPRLGYQGDEGNFTFSGEQVTRQDSALGLLITVILRLEVGAGGLTCTLVLPPVRMASKAPQSFDTIAVKTTSTGNLLVAGAQRSYAVFTLHGLAEDVILAF